MESSHPACDCKAFWLPPHVPRYDPRTRPLPMSYDSTPVVNEAMDAVIARCLAGDQTAWEEIVRTHRRKFFNLAYKFVGRHDEAEDLTQDIFIKIFKAL